MSDSSTDCLQCRLVSGGGMVAAGFYVVRSSQKSPKLNRIVISTLGYALVTLGVLRMWNLYPFKNQEKQKQDVKEVVPDQERYIIGELPTKFR